MTMLDDFLVRAVLAGCGVALAAGPMGCFVVWRRMAYFGDATAHASILGLTLAIALDMPPLAGVLLCALAMAATIARSTGHAYAADTMLGVAAHAALATGLVAMALIPGMRLDLMGYLFGDILAVTRQDLVIIWGGVVVIVLLMGWYWRALLTATLNTDLAVAEGERPARIQMALILALAILVAVAIKVVGALLITAMLIIPAAAARRLARTPEAMAILAVLVGMMATVAGLGLSYRADTPAGPSIIVAAFAILCFFNGLLIKKTRQ